MGQTPWAWQKFLKGRHGQKLYSMQKRKEKKKKKEEEERKREKKKNDDNKQR